MVDKKVASQALTSTKVKKIYFSAGDTVTIRQELGPNKPIMVVKEVEKSVYKDDNRGVLFGIKCFWFTKDGLYQEKTFNTKDLVKIQQEIHFSKDPSDSTAAPTH